MIKSRKWNIDLVDFEAFDFCEWVAEWVCRDDFAEDADDFAELACRKLWAFGLIEKDSDYWKYGEDD